MDFFEGKKGIFFGDSLIQGIGVLPAGTKEAPTEDVVSQLEKILKCNIVNGAFGGTGMSNGCCGFPQMVDTLLTGDFTQQYALAERFMRDYPDEGFDGLLVQIERMKALKKEELDFICIAFGTNDWTFGVEPDNPSDQYDGDTLLGALRKGIRDIMTNLPGVEIYVFTPTYRRWKDKDSDTLKNEKTGLSLREVSDMIAKTCKELHIPCANMYVRSLTNVFNWDFYTSDGTHRNAAGYALLAKQYAKFMLSH